MSQKYFPLILFPFYVRMTIFIPAFLYVLKHKTVKLMCNFRFPTILFPFIFCNRVAPAFYPLFVFAHIFLFPNLDSSFSSHGLSFTFCFCFVSHPWQKHHLFFIDFSPSDSYIALCILTIYSAVHFMLFYCFPECTLQYIVFIYQNRSPFLLAIIST
jgi:hypothetical protein